MKKVMQPTVIRAVLLPIVGAVGTVIALTWPVGHKAFCAAIGTGLVL